MVVVVVYVAVVGEGGWLLLLEVGLGVEEEEAEEKLTPYLWIILFNSCNINNKKNTFSGCSFI